jgi:hypothetical protein
MGFEELPHGVQFKKDLLKPELISLVDDDKEHFVVSRWASFGRFRGLSVKDLIKF